MNGCWEHRNEASGKNKKREIPCLTEGLPTSVELVSWMNNQNVHKAYGVNYGTLLGAWESVDVI
jgi:hypothetical protein